MGYSQLGVLFYSLVVTGFLYQGADGADADSKQCYSPVDIVLLLDSSGSLGLKNWHKELDFATKFLQFFEISPEKSHVGVIDFSEEAKVHLTLTEPKQDAAAVKASLAELIDEKYYQNGITNTQLGLLEASAMFQHSKQEGTRSVPQILIVVTDGYTTWKDGKKGIDLILPHIQILSSMKVTTYAIAIGDSVDNDELQALAGTPKRVLKKDNFDDLVNDVKKIAEMVCTTPVVAPESSKITCDIRFKKVGCYKDNQVDPRPLENYALNARDPSIANYIGISIDWDKFGEFLEDFVCRCAKMSAELKHKYFGIQNFGGECWTGATETYNKNGESESSGCVNTSFETCTAANQYCTGINERNQVYVIE